jgi:subtilisin family serine protease
MRERQPSVQVGVFDQDRQSLKDARVRLESDQVGGKSYDLSWDGSRRCYFARGVDLGSYRLLAERDNEREEQRVEVRSAGLRTVVLLNSRRLPFLYRGPVKTPFERQPDLFAIALDENMPNQGLTKLSMVAEQEHLSCELSDWNGRPPRHARVFRFACGTSADSRARITQRLAEIGGVHRLGPLVHFVAKDSISCLTDELVVRFRPGTTRAQIRDFVQRGDLTILRKLTVTENVFVFRLPSPPCYEMLDRANELAPCDLVAYAEPNLISIGRDDAIDRSASSRTVRPTDFLFPMQWHLARIGCPEAWQVMYDEISPDRAMGSPSITIAVVDWGIDVDHPEFAGRLSNGKPKVCAVFDFHNMQPHHRRRAHGHGTCCAGVATASADNDGVCGVAGNCRLMAIRRPEGLMATETAYSDMYLWIAGYDPLSPRPDFPKRLRRGADVISNSFGYAAGLPISGLMKDTFELLAERGRKGRGVLLFFSAGNNSMQDFTLERPWAASDRTLAVTASTLGNGGSTETRASESSIGDAYPMLDFCAPSATALNGAYDPPKSWAIITAADRCSSDPDHNLQPNAPARCSVHTTLSDDAAKGEQAPAVVSSTGFALGQFVLIGRPGSEGAEFNQIAAIPDGTHLQLRDTTRNSHSAGTPVAAGRAEALHSFSGTSCATAVAAGVGALMLSACPRLKWSEVRDILRDTAVKIDSTGQWRDVDGARYSSWYGFGRIDALAAVKAALARRTFWADAAARAARVLRLRRCGAADT